VGVHGMGHMTSAARVRIAEALRVRWLTVMAASVTREPGYHYPNPPMFGGV